MIYLDEILDRRYDVYLHEENYVWNEYDDVTNNSPKLLRTFKSPNEADEYLEICNKQLPEVQKKYRGKISYFIRPMYLRTRVIKEWTNDARPQSEIDEFLKGLYKPRETEVYTG